MAYHFDPYATARRPKAKRSGWDDEVEQDLSISRKCELGRWIECGICVDKAGRHSVIQADAAYGLKKWKRHINGACHLKNAGLAPPEPRPAPMLDALPMEPPTLLEPPPTMRCPGLYGGDPKYLALMVQYGDIKSERLEIVATMGSIGAFSKQCTKAAYTGSAPRKKTSKHQMKTACTACYELAGDERDSFCKRVDNMERVDMVLDAMLSNHKGPLAKKVIVDFTKSNTKANPNWNYLLEKAKLFKAAMNY
ncbi:hypothetical protein SPRG_14834 [Saprolegnia parasitica CBS 223.65]|uniref:Uncharacterized protein n=1 Tax=Saprolegnia parasitica (strain CBS 223.65) TaxID=695850 RepID=A0A067C036_SAPPC|nr:hypothetical protein SPRG_14834 [Saprolegnia parasitica CBS 223.65]KDO19926.1 hypothetical protein SPRG_14834 [Saprolegnia parasitica CBS 223.65]|eukprot:XP_012209365.1 hypothetical protein SPRG_14834 [Saprolegnia parasitica CBS 223.65]